MVYTRKTWISNEVITKDALNNIETGIVDGRNLSEIIVDADKDMDAKSLSNLKNVTADNFISGYIYYIAHNTTKSLYYNATQYTSDGTLALITMPANTLMGSSLIVYVTAKWTGLGELAVFTQKNTEALVRVPQFGKDAEATGSYVFNDLKAGDVLKVICSFANASGYYKNITLKGAVICGSNPI